MYESFVNSNLLIREWLNGSLFPLTLNLTFIIAVFILDSIFEAGRTKSRWFRMPGMVTAVALFAIFMCESMRALAVWYILRAGNVGDLISDWAAPTSDILLVATGFGLIPALLRCTYIFTPPKWGHWVWATSLLSTIAFLLLSHALTHLR